MVVEETALPLPAHGRQVGQHRRRQPVHEGAEVVRHDDRERQLVPQVRQPDRPPVVARAGREVGAEARADEVHHRHLDQRPVGQGERSGLRQVRVEGLLPRSLEVDSVHQDEARQVRDVGRSQQLGDPLLGPLAHPAVDEPPGGLRVGDEVDEAEPGAEPRREQVQVGGVESVAALGEGRVRAPQRHLARVPLPVLDPAAARGERLVERVQLGHELVQAGGVEDAVHLGGGLAAGAGAGHAERDDDAGRRDDDVAAVRADPLEQLEPEGVERGGRPIEVVRSDGGTRHVRHGEDDPRSGWRRDAGGGGGSGGRGGRRQRDARRGARRRGRRE